MKDGIEMMRSRWKRRQFKESKQQATAQSSSESPVTSCQQLPSLFKLSPEFKTLSHPKKKNTKNSTLTRKEPRRPLKQNKKKQLNILMECKMR
jgi:hypothetical protein